MVIFSTLRCSGLKPSTEIYLSCNSMCKKVENKEKDAGKDPFKKLE